MATTRDAFVIFGDEEFAWIDEQQERPPAGPPLRPPARPRRQTRTLARDLARARAALARTAGPGPYVSRTLVLGAVSVVVAVGALVAVLVGRFERTPAPPAPTPAATPQAVPGAPSVRLLGPGMRGAAVRDLQAALVALGFYADAEDGVFAETTGAALVAFQRNRGLAADGVLGPVTARALIEAVVERASTDAATAVQGIDAALRAGRLGEQAANRYRAIVAEALADIDRLPPGRSATLALVLADVAAHAGAYDEPRALTLLGMLEANARHLSAKRLPTQTTDIAGADGIAYRFARSHGFQFHPLANFSKLNRLVTQERREEVAELAKALVSRGVVNGKTLLWEYYFPFGGPPRWTSGFVQAVAAQALARSAAFLDDPSLYEAAGAAYRAIPRGLLLNVADGVWVREYGFTDMPILNAQLQSLVSLSDYVQITDDADAAETTIRMAAATRAVLHRFDTGCWSLYSLDGSNATVGYHTYHVSLLKSLARQTGEALWADTAARWERYAAAGGPC